MTFPPEPQLTRGGDKIFEYGIKGLEGFLGIFAGLLILLTTILAIVLDLGLGPNFQYGQADLRHVDLGLSGHIIPWIHSVATTGLLYALFKDVPIKSNATRAIRMIGYLIMAADGLSDMGGFNGLMLHDPMAAARVFLPLNAGMEKWFFSIFVLLLCTFHEPLLGLGLSRYEKYLSRKELVTLGDKLENGFVWVAGLIFNLVRSLAIWGGAVSMLLLDIALAPQLGDTLFMSVIYGVASFLAGGVLVLVWRFYHHVGNEGIKRLGNVQRGMIVGSIFITVFDSWLDLRGLNELLYGADSVVIPAPTVAWGLTFGMTAVMCTANEPFSSELFRPLRQLFDRPKLEVVDLDLGSPGMDMPGGFPGGFPGTGGGFPGMGPGPTVGTMPGMGSMPGGGGFPGLLDGFDDVPGRFNGKK